MDIESLAVVSVLEGDDGSTAGALMQLVICLDCIFYCELLNMHS